jgi:hypothetical protein
MAHKDKTREFQEMFPGIDKEQVKEPDKAKEENRELGK